MTFFFTYDMKFEIKIVIFLKSIYFFDAKNFIPVRCFFFSKYARDCIGTLCPAWFKSDDTS